jgi:hypothetical protein
MALPDGMSSCTMCVEIMTGTTWTDVSDSMTVVDPPEQTRMVGAAYVFGEDTAVISAGKREPVDVTVRGVWSEGTAAPFYTVYAEFTAPCGDMVAVRFTPGGCSTSHDTFYTSTTKSEVTSLTFPGGDAGSADVIMFQFVVHSPDLTRAAWS